MCERGEIFLEVQAKSHYKQNFALDPPTPLNMDLETNTYYNHNLKSPIGNDNYHYEAIAVKILMQWFPFTYEV